MRRLLAQASHAVFDGIVGREARDQLAVLTQVPHMEVADLVQADVTQEVV